MEDNKKNEIVNENLLKDLKDFNPIDKIFNFFINEEKDIENGDEAKKMYEKLGWKGDYYDVINSFWTTFSFAMHKEYPKNYEIAEKGNVQIYKNHNNKCNYNSFPEKYFKEKSYEREHVNNLCEKLPEIEDLARLCHCVANFMPCPKKFNSAKGCLDDVKDYFPLMIDKIQKCIDKKPKSEDKIQITETEIKEWHQFFINNQERLCLNMYYQVTKNDSTGKYIIKGIPLFEGQSLSNPYPKDEKDIKKCLEEIIKRIKKRANLIQKKYQ